MFEIQHLITLAFKLLIKECGLIRQTVFILLFPISYQQLSYASRIGIILLLSLSNIKQAQLNLYLQNVATFEFSISNFFNELIIGIFFVVPFLITYQAYKIIGDLCESIRGQQIGLVIDPLFSTEEQPLSQGCSHLYLVSLCNQISFPSLLLALESFIIFPNDNSISNLIGKLSLIGITTIVDLLSASISMLIPLALLILAIECCAALYLKLLPSVSLNSEIYLLRMMATVLFALHYSQSIQLRIFNLIFAHFTY